MTRRLRERSVLEKVLIPCSVAAGTRLSGAQQRAVLGILTLTSQLGPPEPSGGPSLYRQPCVRRPSEPRPWEPRPWEPRPWEPQQRALTDRWCADGGLGANRPRPRPAGEPVRRAQRGRRRRGRSMTWAASEPCGEAGGRATEARQVLDRRGSVARSDSAESASLGLALSGAGRINAVRTWSRHAPSMKR